MRARNARGSESKRQWFHETSPKVQLNIKSVGRALGVELNFRRGAHLKPAGREESLCWITSVMQWKKKKKKNICFGWKFRGCAGISEPCLGVVGFACRGIIWADCFLHADIYNLCVLWNVSNSSCQTLKPELHEGKCQTFSRTSRCWMASHAAMLPATWMEAGGGSAFFQRAVANCRWWTVT